MKTKELFTVVVADDEQELREAVCRLIPWEQLGFQLVGSAGNGLDALQLVEQLQPDLLLTDIRMPFISGTALAKQVRELQPLIQVAFLSGYDDFEYARQAIDNDVIAYLLKPISMAQLSTELGEIREKMQAKFNALISQESDDLRMTVASLLLDGFGRQAPENLLHEKLQQLGLVVTEPYSLCVLSIVFEDIAQPGQSTAATVDRVLRKYFSCCSVPSGERVLTLILSEDGFDRLGSALDELTQVCRRILGCGCTIGVSRSFSRFSRCHSACREAVDAQRFSLYQGIHSISDMLSPAAAPSTAEDVAARLEKLLTGQDRAQLEKYLSAYLSPELINRPENQIAVLKLLTAAHNIFESSLPQEEFRLLLKRCDLTSPFSMGIDEQQLRRQLMDFCLLGHDIMLNQRRDGVSLLCDRAMKIIDQQYMDEGLSLGSVSEQLHVSPNYLSANMKKNAGDTFINLLIKRRMEEAQSLLASGKMKIAEVARRCGYSDQHYFSYCFKKYYGVSPAKMRRSEDGEDRP